MYVSLLGKCMLKVIFFVSSHFYFSFFSTSLEYISKPKNKRKKIT